MKTGAHARAQRRWSEAPLASHHGTDIAALVVWSSISQKKEAVMSHPSLPNFAPTALQSASTNRPRTLAGLRSDVATRHRAMLEQLNQERRHDWSLHLLGAADPLRRRVASGLRDDCMHLGTALLVLRLKLSRASETGFVSLFADYDAIVSSMGDLAWEMETLRSGPREQRDDPSYS